LFLGGFDLTPTFRDVNKKYSTRYYLSLVLIDEGALILLIIRPFFSQSPQNLTTTVHDVSPRMRGAEIITHRVYA